MADMALCHAMGLLSERRGCVDRLDSDNPVTRGQIVNVMGAPVKLSNPDYGVRSHCVYDLEKTLVAFLKQLFDDALRLDNPDVNFDQPDTVPFDPTERARTLVAKVPPYVVRGRVPRTVTGELDLSKVPDVPHIIVQAVSAKVNADQTIVTVKLMIAVYDENPNSQGYQDVQNMIEAIAIAFTTFGQGAIDEAYPIVMPIEWQLREENCFPHFIGEMQTNWQLPSGRPLPDMETFGIIPAEHIELRMSADTQTNLAELINPS
jgi:hypothetical protein